MLAKASRAVSQARIRRIGPDGTILTVAGGADDPNGGLAINAQIDRPWRIALTAPNPAGDELWLLDEPFVDGDLLYLGIC